jgi:hypothetical protein
MSNREDLQDPKKNDFIPSIERDEADREAARKENDFIPGGEEPFDPDLIWLAGYTDKYPLEPAVIESDLETAARVHKAVNLSSSLRLEPIGRFPGIVCFKDQVLIQDLRRLLDNDLRLIREFLDNVAVETI